MTSLTEVLADETVGASGKSGLRFLKKNPYRKFKLKKKHFWDGNTRTVCDFAEFLLNGYIWEYENADTFHTFQKPQIETMKQLRDQLASIRTREDSDKFWPSIEQEQQIALFDFVRILPSMWD